MPLDHKDKNAFHEPPVHIPLKYLHDPFHDIRLLEKNKNKKSFIVKVDKPSFNLWNQLPEFEAVAGELYRLLANNPAQSPKTRVLKGYDCLHVLSLYREDFRPFSSYSPTPQEKANGGIGALYAAMYILAETDGNQNNLGYSTQRKMAMKIDHDRTFWPLTCAFAGFPPNERDVYTSSKIPGDCFPVTQRDMNRFPDLRDTRMQAPWSLHLQMKSLESFQRDVNKTFIKAILCLNLALPGITKTHMANKENAAKLTEFLHARIDDIERVYLNSPKSDRYLSAPGILDDIIREIEVYNRQFNSKPEKAYRKLDVETVKKAYEALCDKKAGLGPAPIERRKCAIL